MHTAMKHSEGLRKVSINATTSEAGFLKTLIKDVLQGREMLVEPGLSVFTLPNGTIFEFYSIGSNFPDYLFSHSNTVNTYQVNDLSSALESLEKRGASLLGTIVHMSRSSCYCHVGLGDGSVIGLLQYNTEAHD